MQVQLTIETKLKNAVVGYKGENAKEMLKFFLEKEQISMPIWTNLEIQF